MNQLVFKDHDQVVTSSRNIARDFNKQHRHVLDAIDEIKGVAENSADLFYETTYVHEQNKQEYRQFLMNRDGFTLLVMGFTGKEAMKFKLDYMSAFNRMEKQLKQPRILTEREQLVATMKLSIESDERISEIEGQVTQLSKKIDNELTLKHGQAVSLNHAVKKRIETLWKNGVVGALETKPQLYSAIYSQMRRAFHAPGYREVKRVDFDDAMNWVGAWRPL